MLEFNVSQLLDEMKSENLAKLRTSQHNYIYYILNKAWQLMHIVPIRKTCSRRHLFLPPY